MEERRGKGGRARERKGWRQGENLRAACSNKEAIKGDQPG